MKLRIAAVIGLLGIGVGAVFFSLGGPGLLATASSSQYLTATAAVANVVKDVAATGKIAAASTYGLRFGQVPLATSASGTGGNQGGGNSTTWPVTVVKVTVGQAVKKGDLLASADSTYANATLATAQAKVDSAQAKLLADTNGADDATKATLQDAINQAKQNLTNARQSQVITAAQNDLSLAAAQKSVEDAQLKVDDAQLKVDAAQAKLDADIGAGATDAVIAADQASLATQQANLATQQTNLASAQTKLASTKLSITQSNQRAAQDVANADLAVTSAQNNYTLKTSPAPAATIAQDQADILTAQTALTSAQTAVKYASLVAPEDGVVTAVNITAGVAAPTGDAIQLQSSSLQAVASVSETDVSSLTLGMAATVTVTSSTTTINGKLLTISPVSSGTSGQSVVTYQIVVSLENVPSGILTGMTSQVSIRIGSSNNVIAVPATALNGTKDSYTIKVMDAKGVVTSKPVTVGLVTTSLAEIKSGITAGDVVVTGLSSARTQTTTTTGGGAGNILGTGGQQAPGAGANQLGR